MPVRLPSWDTTFGLPPIFEMNLPEGVLRERLRLAFAKATGTFDDLICSRSSGDHRWAAFALPAKKSSSMRKFPFSPWTKSLCAAETKTYSVI